MATVVSTQEIPMFDKWMQGSLYDPAVDTLVDVYSDRLPLVYGVQAAEEWIDKLEAALRNNPPPYRLCGHSDGAQAIELWMRTRVDGSIDPADLEIYLTGAPDHKYNGAYVTPGCKYFEYWKQFGGHGFPDDTPYKTTVFTRQYDVMADQPNDQTNKLAVDNISHGSPIHLGYYKVSLADPENLWITEGSRDQIRYGWSRTDLLPLLTVPNLDYPASFFTSWMPALAASRDAELRPTVESAYSASDLRSPV